jgi:uncharacterized delta-60 repeat protein
MGAISGAQAVTTANDGFDPNANSIVNTIALQPDGKILMGGYFTQLHPLGNPVTGAGYIARLNHDGTVDTSFTAGADNVVRTMVLQPNGQILVGGTFQNIIPTGSSTPVPRSFAARLNTDGTLDPTFNPNANGVVYAMVYQPNGQVVIGGSFTTVQPNGAATATTRNHIARFNVDGSLDTTFDPNTDKTVLSLAVQPNGQIVVGGGFSTMQPNGASTPTTRNCLARVNSDGTLDTSFDPEPNGSVMTILILPNNQIIIGGEFVTVQPNATTSAVQCDFLARLNTDGSVDGSYLINPLQSVSAVALQPDGKLLIGGTFSQVFPVNNLSATASPYIARINTDGSVDTSFLPNPNQAVNAIAVQPDGNVVFGGYFTTVQPEDTSAPTLRNHIARVNSFGVPDSTLDPDQTGTVFVTSVLSNGQILVGGTFLSIGGATQNFFARLNANGSLDTTFQVTVNGPVQSIAVQSNGQIIIGGSFSSVDGIGRGNIARVNPDGTVDGVFNPNVNSNVLAIALLPNNQILIGGGFSLLAPNGSTTGYSVSNLARLNSDGSVDLTFNPAPNGSVFTIAIDANGHYLIGGGFTQIGTAMRSYVARMLPSGELDPADFDPETNLPVYAIAILANNQIMIGGSFTAIAPQTSKAAAVSTTVPAPTNNPYGPQTVLPAPGVSAATPIYINHLARLNTDGTLDTTFLPDPDADVLSIAVQSNGAVVVGGILTSFAPNLGTTGTVRNYIGRVNSDGSLDSGFNPDADQLIDSVTVLSNQNILVGGSFTRFQPNGAASPTYATHLAVLNPDGSLDASFSAGSNSTVTGQVLAFAQQPNGQVIFAGSFSAMDGSLAPYLARLNGDATIDTSFNSGVDGQVNAVAILPNGASTQTPSNSGVWLDSNGEVRFSYSAASNGEVVCSAQQANGQVIIGGLFSNFNGVSGLQNLVRLNTDGTVDPTFNPTPNEVVSAIVIQSNGQIVIGGGFTNVDGVNNAYLARLNTDGTLDTTYAPQPNLQVLCLMLMPNGQIIAGGDFTQMIPTGATTASALNYIGRLNSDGSVDSTFDPDLGGPAYCLGQTSSGQILVGGSFTTVTPNAGTTVDDVQNLVRLNTNGTVDTTFYPDPNAAVSALLVLPNGQVIAGGTFTAWEQNANITNVTAGPIVDSNYITRVNTDGTVDTSFAPNPNGGLSALALQPNGQIVLGGTFTALQPNKTGIPADRSDIARINADGSIDPSFDPSLNGDVDTITLLSDGSLFVGGNFTSVQVGGAALIGGSFANVGGTAAPNLARLNADGSFDSSFIANTDGPVNAIMPMANGSSLVGGTFANVQGQPQANLARVTAAGTFDSTFTATINGAVNTIALQQNGQVIVGGTFTSAGGLNTPNIARLGPSGSPDATFLPSVNGAVDAAVVQPNGQIVIAGAFTSVGGQSMVGLARLNPNGTLDTTFNANANGTVSAVTQQVDGTFFVAGSFTTIGNQPIPYAAHIESNGAVDTSFTPATNAPVDAVMVQPDGKVMLGGGFTTSGGLARVDMARFQSLSPVTQSVTVSPDQTTLTWTRGGSAPEFQSVGFEETIDGTHWLTIGQATTSDGLTWQLTGAPPSGATLFLVRATGIVPSSQFSSSGLVQTLYLANSGTISVVTSPAAATGAPGVPFSFTVTASNAPQTFAASGLPPGLSINQTTGVISGTPTANGSYTVGITVANASGSTSSTLTILISPPSSTSSPISTTSSSDRLVNLSCRAALNGTQNLIAGFVVSGTGTKTLLLRAAGPALGEFGVSGYIAAPELDLYSSSGALISQNTGWNSSLAATFAQVGAFTFPANSSDVALVVTLAPGSYTMHIYDPAGFGGVVLTEVYDADPSPLTSPTRLINISARGTVSPGSGALIGGFVISGSSVKSVLIRGVGPGLGAFGVTDEIEDPVLSVYDANGNLVAQNLNWTNQTVTGPDQATASAQYITSTDANVGAFALSAQNADTALIANLPPGAYTFEVTSESNSTGEALGEVYEIP